ncbi:MAG: M60 family metallopeptidase [Thermonemataceae bacterium]|nr:M60 family metallopeptidase [Thermonemataceae bacterium]
MKAKMLYLLLLTFSKVWLCVGQVFEEKSERAKILKNVGDIPAPGTVGSLFLFNESAFPVLVSATGSRAPIVAASKLGKGRVVAFAHDGFFGKSGAESKEILGLIKNAVFWSTSNKIPTIMLKNLDDLALALSKQGLNVKKVAWNEPITEAKLEGVSVILLLANKLSPSEVEIVKTFIKNGGGGLFADTGWGWQYLNPEKNLRTDNYNNVILSEAGIAWVQGYTGEKTFKPILELSPLYNYHYAKQYVLSNDYRTANKKDFSIALDNLLNGIPMLREENFSIATDFPGNPPKNASKVDKKVTINTSLPYWHCTGLYAEAGEKIHISTERKLKNGLKIRIGSHTDELYKLQEWNRMPEVSVVFDWDGEAFDVFNPFGGMIYLEVPENYEGGNITFMVSGAVEAPFFKLGETSLQDWKNKIRNNPAPWGEIEGKEFAFTIESSYLRNLENPQEIAEFWDKVQAANKELVAWDNTKAHRMRLVFDRQIALGYMHSGYPIMALTSKKFKDEQDNIINLKEPDKWGFVHELGHNHQQAAWTFEGTVEVTCNLFSMYALEKVMKVNYTDFMNDLKPENVQKKWDKYVAANKSFDYWKQEPFLALIMYKQLLSYYGWENLKKVFIAYKNIPEAKLPKTNLEKQDTWLKMFSEIVGENLSDFFDAWGVPTSLEAKKSLQKYPKANLEKLMIFK